jgi:hypothetical protein
MLTFIFWIVKIKATQVTVIIGIYRFAGFGEVDVFVKR